MIQTKLDYCSQLRSPSDHASISKLESVARQFTSQVAGLENQDYWDRLSSLRMYSQERRREPYQIIFVWKVLQGLALDYQLSSFSSPRRGGCEPIRPYKRSSPSAVINAREASLSVKGCRLFNLLPRKLRDITTGGVDQFKAELDSWLATVPDQPSIPGRQLGAKSNSLLDQVSTAYEF